MEIPWTTAYSLLYDRLGSIENSTVHKVFLLLLLHFYDDMPPIFRYTFHIEDHASLIIIVTYLFGIHKLYVSDYKLAFKQSVQESNQAFLGILTAENALESPVGTWIDEFRHIC